MFLINFLKSKAAQAKEISELKYQLVAITAAAILDSKARAEHFGHSLDLATENAHLKRVVSGYKSGETRRAKKEGTNV